MICAVVSLDATRELWLSDLPVVFGSASAPPVPRPPKKRAGALPAPCPGSPSRPAVGTCCTLRNPNHFDVDDRVDVHGDSHRVPAAAEDHPFDGADVVVVAAP